MQAYTPYCNSPSCYSEKKAWSACDTAWVVTCSEHATYTLLMRTALSDRHIPVTAWSPHTLWRTHPLVWSGSVWVDECVCVGGWVYEWMSVWVDQCVSVCVGGWVCVYSVSISAWVATVRIRCVLVSCYIMLTYSMYMLYSRAYQGHALAFSVHNSKHVTLHVQTQSLALCINVSIYWSCCNNNVTADESVCNRPVYVDYWYGLADYGHIYSDFSVHVTLLIVHSDGYGPLSVATIHWSLYDSAAAWPKHKHTAIRLLLITNNTKSIIITTSNTRVETLCTK